MSQQLNQRVARRMAWIETAVRVGGPFPRKAYQEMFGISTQLVSHDLDEFCHQMEKRHIPCQKAYGRIKADLPRQRIFDDLDIRDWYRSIAPTAVTVASFPEVVETPPDVLEAVLRAIRARCPVRCMYVSLTSGQRTATLSPHTIVSAVGREHLRGFDHDRNRFGDYVLARISAPRLLDHAQYIASDDDQDWSTEVSLELFLRDDLEEQKTEAARLGLGMGPEDTSRTLRVRKAMAKYTLQSLGIRPIEYIKMLDYRIVG